MKNLNRLSSLGHEEQLAAIKRFDALPQSVRDLFWEDISTIAMQSKDGIYPFILRIAAYCERLYLCESPIEQMMYWAIERHLYRHCIEHEITPQAQVEAQGKKYRVDLLIKVGDEHMPVIVECDGHEFHEKTKEQARRDKERQRNLQIEGYHVIRFAGSEIFQDARNCADQVVAYISRISQ